MPEVKQISYDLREVAALMVRDQGIRSGLWMIWTRFAHTATNILPPENEPGPSGPASISMLVELGIQRANESGPMTVDAAEVWERERSQKRTKQTSPA
jgi:hypothetical protein